MATTEPLPRVVTVLHLYYTPLLVVLGCIGNALTILVLLQSKLPPRSTCQYLSALALSDSVFLLLQVPPWLDNIGATDVFVRGGFCQVFVYVSYVSCCISAWLVAAFTVERFVAVLHPLQRPALCTVTRARYVVLVLAGAALLANSPMLLFAAPVDGHCAIDLRYMAGAAAFNLCDTVMSFSLPLLVIVILNSRIGITVARLSRERRALHRAEELAAARRAPPAAASQHKITTMLLFVSTVFVLFNLPAYVMRLLAYAYDMNAADHSELWSAVQQIALLVFNTNFGINFILYCLSGQNFRRALTQRIPWCRSRAERSDPARLAAFPRLYRNYSLSTSSVSNVTDLHAQAYTCVSTLNPQCEPPTDVERPDHTPHVMRRWRFDNAQQQRLRVQNVQARTAESYEMQNLEHLRSSQPASHECTRKRRQLILKPLK